MAASFWPTLIECTATFLYFSEASRSSSKISLSFDIREIQKDEKIIKASLIDPKSRKASVRTPTRFYPVSAADSKDSVQDLLNLSGGGWKSTDVTNKVKTWHKRRHKENTIHVYREGQEDDISSRNLHKILQAPFLVVHSRTNIKHAKSSQHEDENEAASLSKPDQRFHYPRSSSSQSCRMKKLEFKTSEIGWERSILANSNLKVNRCEGVCDARIGGNKNKTWNARFRAILASMEKTEDGKPITLPCCAPVDFTPVKLLSIKDVEGRKVTELKTFPNMVVKSCGCV